MSVPNFTSKDRSLCRIDPSRLLKEVVSNGLNKSIPQRFGGATEDGVSGWISRCMRSAQFNPLLIDNSLTANDYYILLPIVNFPNPVHEFGYGNWRLRNENNVGLSVCRSGGNITRVPAHDFDDRNPMMTFGCRPDPPDAPRGNIAGSRETRRRIIDHLSQVEIVAGHLIFKRHPGI